MKVGAHLIFGAQKEPWLEAALRSVSWCDYLCAVNTAPDDARAQENEVLIRRVWQRDRLRIEHLRMNPFDFARARNAALVLADDGDYVLIVDADDVHHNDLRIKARDAMAGGSDVVSAHFWHHVCFKDLWHSEPHREILFHKTPGVRFENTAGGVHEELVHPRARPTTLPDYHYHHFGYLRPARELARKWEFYRSLGAPIHDYDRSDPDHALDDWPRVCKLYSGTYPHAARKVLEGYPSAPVGLWPKREGKPRVGLVLLTWDDAENLRTCLTTLRHTTEPFELFVVDNGSLDETRELINDFREGPGGASTIIYDQGWIDASGNASIVQLPLATALNIGFSQFVDREDLDYVGWIHPDMVFEWPDWLAELVRGMDENPGFAKLGATEAGQKPELRSGNTQCFLVRRTALEEAGLFDERFEACGGHEDWEHNARLAKVGKVMIWPDALVRHRAMATRQRHDNEEAAIHNADLYHKLVGTWEPVV